MKKMAVLINGEFREFDIAIKSWKFINEIDCDIYVSTWDKTIQINKKLNIHIEEDITEDNIKKHFPNATVSILKQSDYATGAKITDEAKTNISLEKFIKNDERKWN